jgi:hypothetical protein
VRADRCNVIEIVAAAKGLGGEMERLHCAVTRGWAFVRFRWVAIMAALALLSACGDGGVKTSLSAEDTAVLGAIGQATTMSGTFHLDLASDDQQSSFDVRVARGNYLVEKYGPAGGSTAPVGELMFLSDGRSFTRTAGGAWNPQDVQLSTSLSGNPGAILVSFGALRGFRRAGTETVEGRPTTRYVATASDLKQVLGMMGLGQLSNANEGATQLGQLLAKYLANARVDETVCGSTARASSRGPRSPSTTRRVIARVARCSPPA